MSRTKLLITFLVLVVIIILALVFIYKSPSIQNEDSIVSLTPGFAQCLKEKLVYIPKNSLVQKNPSYLSEQKVLTQQEEIEKHIRDVVSLYPNLSNELISAIIWRESRYNPSAKNYNSSCVGLMQLSTKWHSKRAQSLGVTNLYDSYGNILTGCDLLSELIESYNLEMALMVYHGGYSYAQKYQTAGTIDQYTKDILSYTNQLKGVA